MSGDVKLQVIARGSSVSTSRAGDTIRVEIDNTATQQAAARANEAADNADAKLAEVDTALDGTLRTDTADQGLSETQQKNARANSLSMFADREINPKEFGWRSDGGQFNDQFVADIAYELSQGRRWAGRDPDAIFAPSVKLEVASTSPVVDIDFGGARILHQFDGQLFSATAPYLDAQPATIVPSTDDLSKGSTDTPSDTSLITISDTTGYVVGSQIKIWSDDLTAGVRVSDGNRRAEYQRVAKVISSTQFETYQRLRDTYTTNVMVARLDTSKRFIMRNGILDASDASLAYQNGAFIATGYWNPVINNMRAVHSQDQFLRLVGCMDIDVHGLFGRDLTTDADPAKAAGYLLALVACQGGMVSHMQGSNLRHGFTPSPGRVSDAQLADRTRDYNRGKTRDINVVGMRGYNCQGAFIDTHDDAENLSFSNGHFQYAYNGPSNTDYAVGLRGMRNRVANVHSEGGSGFWLFTDATDGTVMGGHVLHNVSWRAGPNQQKETYGLRVSGNASCPVVGNTVNGFASESAGVQWGHVRLNYGSVKIVSPDAKCSFLSGGTGKYARMGSSSSLTIEGGTIDFTGTPSGAAARVVLWDSDADALSSAYMERTRLVSPTISAVSAVFDGNGKVGSAVAVRVTSNLRTGFPGGATGFAAGSRAAVDLRTTDATSSQPSMMPTYAPTTTGWTQTIDLEGRAQDIVYAPFNITVASATNGRVLDVTAPAFDGQILVVVNLSTSNDTMRIIKNAAVRLNITADITIPIGGSARLMGQSGKWVNAL